MELICGACHGRLLVETPGTTVACPHCGTHLQAPAAPAAIVATSEAGTSFDLGEGSESAPDPSKATVTFEEMVEAGFHFDSAVHEQFAQTPSAIVAAATAAAVAEQAGGPVPVSSQAQPETAGAANGAATPINSALTGGESVNQRQEITTALAAMDTDGAPGGAGPGATAASTAQSAPGGPTLKAGSEPTASAGAIAGGTSIGSGVPGKTGDATVVQPASKAPSGQAAAAPASVAALKLLVILLVSYASAVTVACVYLMYLLRTSPSPLDLPDIAPPRTDAKKVTALLHLPPEKLLPDAYVLKLGESRRYGSLVVTPQRVTRGPVEFVFDDPTAKQTREPEGPVLKLHLRFENVSTEQEFVPLDKKLVFTKEAVKKTYGVLKANNFVCNVADRARRSAHVLTFELAPEGNWQLKDQNLDRELKPGESMETFIATTPEGIESLAGDLVWRVHFRKGYNPRSYRGVTNLIEVLFKSSDIVDEAPATDKPAAEPENKAAPAGPAGKDA